jgi:hypothetical protein
MSVDLLGSGYVDDQKKILQAYRRKLRPRGDESVEELRQSMRALGLSPGDNVSRTRLVRELRAAIKDTFTKGGRPLGQLYKSEVEALARRLSEHVDGKARNFDKDDEAQFAQGEYLDPSMRKERKDKGVLRKPPRQKRAPSAYNLYVREKMAELKAEGVPVKQRMTTIGAMWRASGKAKAKGGKRKSKSAEVLDGGAWLDYVPPAAKRAAIQHASRRLGSAIPERLAEMSGMGHYEYLD